jgi:hypothetical protein
MDEDRIICIESDFVISPMNYILEFLIVQSSSTIHIHNCVSVEN